MLQRIITAAILLTVLTVIMVAGNWMIGLMATVAICVSLYEEYDALKKAGHRPISIPTWIVAILSVPLTVFCGVKALGILLVAGLMITEGLVIFRRNPRL